ncbi:electron transport complex subunit E [Polycyclovorans algicola]|uniref:electron transport complex subunit E n=1 Tax=Polycyclovorans algicola TaxID=616992 RepID=UPI0004A71A50|nr:electron transport complex subunit E [Polycyclovorans algicola]
MNLSKLVRDGLWTNNPGLVQLLGLCPLLAVSNNFVNALSLGLATLFVLTASNLTVSAIRNVVRPEIRIPVFVMVIASLVTLVELVMNAYFQTLYDILGIFLPIITTNCAIIGRAEAFASKNRVGPALIDGFMMGLGFLLVLVVLGGAREILSLGTLGQGLNLLLGAGFEDAYWTLIPNTDGLLLAALPPGAFIGLGLLIALKNFIDARVKRWRQPSPVASAAAPAGA